MKNHLKRIVLACLMLSLLMTGLLAGCSRGTGNESTPSPSAGETPEPSGGQSPEPTEPAASPSPTPGSEFTIPDVSFQQYDIPDNAALAFVKDMKIGWNLGNTFDAVDCDWLNNELDYESAWAGVKTTEAMIKAIKDAGFNTVRIPVSWHNHVRGEDHTISELWLDRVQEVVDYVINNGMYVIINIHHDMGKDYIYTSSEYLDQSLHYVKRIWTQVAERFKDYDEKMIFESLNEPRMVGSQYEWWLDEKKDECKDAVEALNKLNQAFVDVVRASGGNNASRYLMVPGYAASYSGALNSGFALPKDKVADKLIVSVHAYTPYNFALEAGGVNKFNLKSSGSTGEINSFMDRLHSKFISKGIPVVIGEFGARNKNNNTQDRIDYATYYVAAARARGITCIWWDNNAFTGNGELFGLFNRKTMSWPYPEIVEGMMKYAD
ncbi:MAG TPA: glycoside hydrolase family 5 protein [Candidatus Atribacteria bacterium]|nr:glycoside hydrolase family 5 protein [Candidatus Atribacteria bacterium]